MRTQPSLNPVPDKNKYELAMDYELVMNGVEIVVPRYFNYDGASIPALAWQLTYPPFHPDVMLPSLIHDWLFYNHQVDRKTTDEIYYGLLRNNGVHRVKAKAMWGVVRMLGGFAWDNTDEHTDMLVALCNRVRHHENFERYVFPADVIEQSLL